MTDAERDTIGAILVELDERLDLTFKIWVGRKTGPIVVVYLTNGPTLVCGGARLLEALEHTHRELEHWPEWKVNGDEPAHTHLLPLTVWVGSDPDEQPPC